MKINIETLSNEYTEWLAENGTGRNKDDLRFGQYIINKYGDPKKAYPSIFYLEHARDAYSRIIDYLNVNY